MEKIDAIILAGGEGKRLRDLVSDVPKPLVVVNGKPFLDILLSQLSKCGYINQLILAIGYKASALIEKYKNCRMYNFNIAFSVEERLLGTGGGIKKALGYTEAQDVLVMNGDSFTEVEIEDLIYTHRFNNSKLTIVLLEVADTRRYGSIKINNQKRVVSFEEKARVKKSGFINAGIYMMQRDIFDTVEENEVISLEKDLLPAFTEKFQGGIYGYLVKGKFIDIGVPEAYQTANEYLKTLKD